MNKNRIALIAVTAVILTACSSTKKETPTQQELDYHTPGAKNPGDMLIVPPDLTGITQENRYTLPAGSGAVRASQIEQGNVNKDQVAVLPQVKNMHIEREGSQRWLSIDDKPPEDIWPMLKVFWQENGFIIDQEDPTTGFMQTQWAENRATIPTDIIRRLFQKVGLGSVYSASYRDRFVIRLERQKGGGSLVTFSHQGMEEEFIGKEKDTTKWVPRDNDPNLEAQMLSRFMMRLGADQATVERELTQNPEIAGELAKLDNNRLILSGSHDRNLHRVGLALNRIGLTVLSLDEANGVFLTQPADMETDTVSNKKPGLFKRWFGGKKTPEKAAKAQIAVAVRNTGNNDIVTLHTADGKEYTAKDSKDILQRLWKELR
ncbi:MAG: outer membrane protein assembly factor BamC [Neisseriaceae bacterium]|nr:outer membrane protein assembly factor BamC [Neisseriaceae bacterium]MBR1819796.1 outer membrane protein assembly factor BamC [Neisseriaceae bacterium]